MRYSSIVPVLILFVNMGAQYEWAIIGAGPAGITTIGVLLDLGIPENKIAWIDPEFKVGRLPIYNNVPANNQTIKFIEFIQDCKTFQKCTDPEIEELLNTNPYENHELKVITKPLQCITNNLRRRLDSYQTKMHYFFFENDLWNILTTNDQTIKAKNVVLATGSYPKEMDLHIKGTHIPLDIALNKNQLQQVVNKDDVVAVVGSAHSAVLILKYLCDFGVKKVYNFYNKQLLVETSTGMMINPMLDLFGVAAKWAREVLAIEPPQNLERLQSTAENLEKILPTCTKTIYAVGYQPNNLPEIKESTAYQYDKNGIIGPRLFGIGIAFPEMKERPDGQIEAKVGLTSFLDYAQRIVPGWLTNSEEVIKYNRERKANIIDCLSSILKIELL